MSIKQKPRSGSNKGLKNFIDHVRQDLIDNIEKTRQTLMGAIKAALKSKLRDEATKLDKIRSRLDIFRETFNYNDPVMKIYRKEEQAMLKEKRRFRGVVVLLELFLVEISFLREKAEEALWTATNIDKVQEGSLKEIVETIEAKLTLYQKSMEKYEEYLKASLGQDSLKVLKKQLMDNFDKKELDSVVRLVKWNQFHKLEQKYLDPEDMVEISPPPPQPKPEESVKKFNDDLWEEPEEAPAKEPERYESDDLLVFPLSGITKEGITVGVTTASAPVATAHVPLITPEAYPEEVQATPDGGVVESNLETFIKEATGKSINDDIIRSFVLEKANAIKASGDNPVVPMAKIYEELAAAHPNWRVKPKKMLRIMREMQKNGIIAKVEKLETGFFMVQLLPVELTQDPQKILELAKTHGFLTKEEVINTLQWPEYRAENALNFLEQKGLARTDVSFIEGKRYFFMNK